MSTINPHYTLNYSQPAEYHFSHDSVFLARIAFEALREKISPDFEVLDLCAGCGIIGLDFLFHCQTELGVTPKHSDFLEVQKIYEPHFHQNARALPQASTRFFVQNYSAWAQTPPRQKYDLILCNPPYFQTGQGKLSPSEFKNRCRFFIDSDFPTLIRAIQNALKPSGVAYALVRDQTDHGYDVLAQTRSQFQDNLLIEHDGDIRGTHVFRIRHNCSGTNKKSRL